MENLEICSKCKGRCCKSMGCHYSPNDFKGISFEILKNKIEEGNISIDWWEGNPFNDDRDIQRAFFLRVRNVHSPIIDPSWGGRCKLLTDEGCSLPYKDRPKGGRELIPHESFMCNLTYSKDECAKDWYVYNDIFQKLEKYFREKEKPNNVDPIAFIKKILESMESFNKEESTK